MTTNSKNSPLVGYILSFSGELVQQLRSAEAITDYIQRRTA